MQPPWRAPDQSPSSHAPTAWICKLRLVDHQRRINLVLAHLAIAVDHKFCDHAQFSIHFKQ